METYSIIDLEGYADAMRQGAAASFEEEHEENLDEFITVPQVINLIKKNNLGKDENQDYIIDENIFNNVFEEIRQWLYEVGLCKLAAKGLVDCAWDSGSNEMIFWLPNKEKIDIHSKHSKENNE
jgi:hypothetical protein